MGKLNLGKVLWNVFPQNAYSGDKGLWGAQHYYMERAKANPKQIDWNPFFRSISINLTQKWEANQVVVINTSVDIEHLNYHSGDTKPLRPYGGPDWTILVNTHGNQGPHSISGGAFAVTPLRLKEMLYMDGLAQNHKYIRLLSCYAGGLYKRPSDATTCCFAKMLATVMGQKHIIDGASVSYPNILVGGYQGTVSAPARVAPPSEVFSSDSKNAFSSTMVEIDGRIVPNRDPASKTRTARYIVWFNAKGDWVKKDGSANPLWGEELAQLDQLAKDMAELEALV
jgi:hypothetical protein